MAMNRSQKNFMGKFCLASGSLLVGLVLVEVGLRLAAKLGSRPSLAEDPVLGWDSVPAGHPVGEETAASPVLFLGDSFTQNNDWPAQVSRICGRRGINAGASGFGTYQQFLKLRRCLLENKPAAVVLQFYAWNDLRDNWAWPGLGYNPEMLVRPYLSQEGEEFWPDYPWKWLDEFKITSYFGKRSLVRAWQKADRVMRGDGVDAVAAQQRTLVAGLCADEAWQPFYLLERQEGPFVRGAWQVTESCFGQIAKVCGDQKISLLVLALDAPFTVDAEKWAHVRSQFPLDRDLPMRRLKGILARLQIPAVFPQEKLRSWAASTMQPAYDGDAESLTGHLTPAAQGIVAAEVAAGLKPLLDPVP